MLTMVIRCGKEIVSPINSLTELSLPLAHSNELATDQTVPWLVLALNVPDTKSSLEATFGFLNFYILMAEYNKIPIFLQGFSLVSLVTISVFASARKIANLFFVSQHLGRYQVSVFRILRTVCI